MEEAIWVSNSYCSTHSILLVGEGDFSFSLSLANQFGSGRHIVATTRDTKDNLVKKYGLAKSNIRRLKHLDGTVMLEIDATTMARHPDLTHRKFDRIIYNFPHAGFKGKEKDNQIIRMHQKLVSGFLEQARCLIRQEGEIHISHKTTGPFIRWNLPALGSEHFLYLFEQVDFNIEDFPGYHNKRGDGKYCDKPFPLGKCSRFKFKLMEPSGKQSLFSRQPAPQPPKLLSDSTAPQPPYLFPATSLWPSMLDLRHRLNMKRRIAKLSSKVDESGAYSATKALFLNPSTCQK